MLPPGHTSEGPEALGVLICEPIRYDHGMGKVGGLALVAVMALTGCAASPEPTPAIRQNAVSVVTVKSELKEMNTATDATIQAMADSICRMYASGKSEAEVTALVIAASAMVQIGDDGLKVARAAVKHQCPEYA